MSWQDIHQSLLTEAQASPRLLSDLAGLEAYVAESYSIRSFTELLQNADDAQAQRFLIESDGDVLFVANDGRPFNKIDLEAICRSATSSKLRGETIGYRGIGFKSVVSFSTEVHLVSGAFKISFSRSKTQELVPEANRVPLIRIPHELSVEWAQKHLNTFDKLLAQGYQTIFAFTGLNLEIVNDEFNSFEKTSMLFLKNVLEIKLNTTNPRTIRLESVTAAHNQRTVQLVCDYAESQSVETERWLLFDDDDVTAAIRVNDKSNVDRLELGKAVVHAFLPCEEATGLGLKLNGDISTDPARRRVQFDQHTKSALEKMATLLINLCFQILSEEFISEFKEAVFPALLPTNDIKLMQLQKRNFGLELLEHMQKVGSERLSSFVLRPTWLNAYDFTRLANLANLKPVPLAIEELNGARRYLEYLGVRVGEVSELSDILVHEVPSLQGAAEIVGRAFNTFNTTKFSIETLKPSWRIWHCVDGKFHSLEQLILEPIALSDVFFDAIMEKSLGGYQAFSQFLKAFVPLELVERIYKPPAVPTGNNRVETSLERAVNPKTRPLSDFRIVRWRAAEEQARAILEREGYSFEDVSRKFLGYDLEGRDPSGAAVFVEVKSVETGGAIFTITNNEYSTASQKGSAYMVMILCQRNDRIEYMIVRDPVAALSVEKQCKQWVWECADYRWLPTEIKFS